MIEVKGKERESFESILRRFSRKVQQSGVLTRARKIRFFQREKSRNLQRTAAQHRSKMREVREEMKRLGKFVPTKRGYRR